MLRIITYSEVRLVIKARHTLEDLRH